MPWFAVDDKLHEHRKARAAKKAAIGVWTLAGSWCADNLTDGFVPADVLPRWGGRADASALVRAGLWLEAVKDGEPGWQFHDWARFQPDAASIKAKREAESEGGKRGNHKRWHKGKKVFVPSCEFCQEDRGPDQVPDWGPESGRDGSPDSPPTPPLPEPLPLVSSNELTSTSAAESTALDRPDVDRLCEHLADRIQGNGSKRPTITKGWQDAARLMLDKDERPEHEIRAAIDWCQSHEFWRANILSMPKLREKYDQMRLQASSRPAQPRRQAETNDLFDAAMTRAIARGGHE